VSAPVYFYFKGCWT